MNIKKFITNHPEILLSALALVFIALIAGYFVWGVSDVVASVDMALEAPSAQEKTGFDLAGAKTLDLRGLVDQSAN